MTIRALIIEDEPPAAQRLKKLIAMLRPDWVLEEPIDSIEDAVEWFQSHEIPQVVFMDIQLADGLSFEIFKQVKVECPIIFTTAFNNHTLEAFKVNSVDYLLKPIEQPHLELAITKFEKTRIPTIDMQLITQLLQQNGKSIEKVRKRFLVKTAGRLSFIPIEDIAFFFSDEGNTFITTRSGERFLVDKTIEDIEKEIPSSQFFRINRKMIVHIESIARIEPHFNNRFVIETHPTFEVEIIVSRLRVAEFKDWLDQ
jgi:two-component system, LytTR family, response regulator LytT